MLMCMRTPPTTFCQPLPRQDLSLTDSVNGLPDNVSLVDVFEKDTLREAATLLFLLNPELLNKIVFDSSCFDQAMNDLKQISQLFRLSGFKELLAFFG